MCQLSADGVVGENAVIQTTHTHRVSAPSVFLQKQNNEPGSSTYFEERVPVPEDDSEVTDKCYVRQFAMCQNKSISLLVSVVKEANYLLTVATRNRYYSYILL